MPLTDRYQTLGGFLVDRLQKIPTTGESLQYQDLDLTVVQTIGPRLYKIRIARQENNPNYNNKNATLSDRISEITQEEKTAQIKNLDSDLD